MLLAPILTLKAVIITVIQYMLTCILWHGLLSAPIFTKYNSFNSHHHLMKQVVIGKQNPRKVKSQSQVAQVTTDDMPPQFASEAVTYVGNHWTNILLSSLIHRPCLWLSALRSPAPAFLFWWTVLLSGICIQIISALLFWFIVPQKAS